MIFGIRERDAFASERHVVRQLRFALSDDVFYREGNGEMTQEITVDSVKETIFNEVKSRVDEVRGRIDAAARKSGRVGDDVLLVAVSKYAEPSDCVVEGFLRSGIFDLAENRPQRLLEKVDVWRSSPYWKNPAAQIFPSSFDRKSSLEDKTLRWHFIGSLQRNKVRRILPFVSLIHSVDSWKLLETIERILSEEEEFALEPTVRRGEVLTPPFSSVVSVLLEVHISEDSTKQGFTTEEVLDVLPKTRLLKHVKVCGLMGMAGLKTAPCETRRQFATLRQTLEKCRETFPELVDLKELSMGMSGDFEIAIEEGATITRLGSILYPHE